MQSSTSAPEGQTRRVSARMSISRANAGSKLRTAAAILILVGALGGCQQSSKSRSVPRLALASCAVSGGSQARCGILWVAEDPSAPDGRQIPLNVVVLPAKASRPAADPLFYFEGGPGGAATDEVAWAARHFSLFNQRHDIVLVDQRGTGASNRVTCSTSVLSASADATQIEAGVQACLTSIKDRADPRFYTTPIAVDDVDQVRAALGYDKIDLYGVSYGVSSGLTYIQRHGSHVRAAVLDSGSLLDVHLYELMPRSAQEALASLFVRCESSATCAAAYPALRADFAAVTANLARAPITSTVVDRATGNAIRMDLPAFMGLLIDTYLKVAPGSVSFPKDIHAAAGGDWTALLKVFAGDHSATTSIPIMAITIRCSDAWASQDPSKVAATLPKSPVTPDDVSQATGMNAVCQYWPHAVGASGAVKSSAPIVFLNGVTDPVDPPSNVANAQAHMPNSLVVSVAGIGHWQLDFDPTGCLTDATNSFLDRGLTSSPTAWSCAQALPLPEFAG